MPIYFFTLTQIRLVFTSLYVDQFSFGFDRPVYTDRHRHRHRRRHRHVGAEKHKETTAEAEEEVLIWRRSLASYA
jgi:hypothetical protein